MILVSLEVWPGDTNKILVRVKEFVVMVKFCRVPVVSDYFLVLLATGRDQKKNSKGESNDSTKTKPGPIIDKIKRAATSALSAAAAKAKLLANQEEDQIQQLATLLIEKQVFQF